MTESPPPRVPPRFIPVLTEVVHADTIAPPLWQESVATVPPAAVPTATAAPLAPLPAAALEALEDQLIHRVMQRVDVSLERQLHDAVATMVLQHTQSLVPRLREEIEFVVRQAVAEAVAAELAQRQKF